MESGIYTFLVERHATKGEIAKSVEKLFDVNVARVNVLKKASKTKRIYATKKYSKTSSGKKAIVVLQKGQTIGLFTTKKESKKSQRVKKGDSPKQAKPAKTKSTESKNGKRLLGRLRRARSNQDERKESE